MMKTILITGGTGLIGSKLSSLLISKGYQVRHLSRNPVSSELIKAYYWDLNKSTIDQQAFEGVDAIIHLAGAGIADEKWSSKRKKEIVNSRVDSTQLLFDYVSKMQKPIQTFIAASATGIYPNSPTKLFNENAHAATGFLGDCCTQWEEKIAQFESIGIRTVKLRTGIVLAKTGGALPKMANPIKLGVGSAIGNGQQWMSWIDEDDLVNMYLYALENKSLNGAYNAVSPEPCSNEAFTKTLAKTLHRWILLPKVPAFFIKILLGEMSIIVLGSTKVSAEKILAAGFEFKFENLAKSLDKIYHE
jgi:uncharacterized protein (TIGR01777 family)